LNKENTSLIQLCTSVEEGAKYQQTNIKQVWKRKFSLEGASKPEKCEARRVKIPLPFISVRHVLLLCQFSNRVTGWCGDNKT